MEFNKNTHKVKHQLLTDRDEVRAFIDFLLRERRRHVKEGKYSQALVELWESQVLRHIEDIEAIDNSIQEVKGRLGL